MRLLEQKLLLSKCRRKNAGFMGGVAQALIAACVPEDQCL
jgi:hypothetical protein